MIEVSVKEGDWVLFRDSTYRPIEVRMKQAAKVTPKLVKFVGTGWPRQTSILSVTATFGDEATALSVLARINGGVCGEYERRRCSAENERSRRITEALNAANAKISAILAEFGK